MICKNCKNDFQGNFCSSCGQKADTRRLSWSYMTNEVFESLLQMNHGLFFTIKELAIRPGHSIREFLAGKRKQHFKPLAFLLLIATIYAFIVYLLGNETYLGGFLSGIMEGFNDAKDKDSIPLGMINWLATNFAYATLFFLPIFSFASYISFRRSTYNYFEHLGLNIYIAGQQIMIYIVFTILIYLFSIKSDNAAAIPVLGAIVYTYWTYIQFFKERTKINVISRVLQTYILNIILIAIVFLLLSAIIFFLGITE